MNDSAGAIKDGRRPPLAGLTARWVSFYIPLSSPEVDSGPLDHRPRPDRLNVVTPYSKKWRGNRPAGPNYRPLATTMPTLPGVYKFFSKQLEDGGVSAHCREAIFQRPGRFQIRRFIAFAYLASIFSTVAGKR